MSEYNFDDQIGYTEKIYKMISGKGLRAFVQTYGCQQNEADSEHIAGMLIDMGYSLTDAPDNADIIIVNTCAVREHAELKALSKTGQYKHLKLANPDLIIGIGGCMVTQEHRCGDIKNKYPYVDFLFGTSMLPGLPQLIYRTMKENKRIMSPTGGVEDRVVEGIPVKRESSFLAWVPIMYGCNNFCSYCVVPYVRGRERSRTKEAVLEEVRGLAKAGYKELTLLGQNVNSYGKGLYDDYDFADLLSDICAVDGDFKVRFMTSHPKDATKKLIDVIAANDKAVKQFHLPIQSGSDRILKMMNRKYTRDSYYSLIEYMREKMPDIGITTDIIVGFPGETEEDFEDTLDMLRRVRYDNIYSFIYSKRKGTPAAEMEDNTSKEEKNERFRRLLEVQNEISLSKNKEYEGKTVRVLVESRSKTDTGK
ncbi:MAG: tRNA (N6-isopentenyl adenosine(37)-C2)-methylthiotransferase MiaB, partial [Clostridia bacterium]|nr:tRNA (N6-isopentenyl adenosine(37)-C2)-methylthiotransferase MiaB [Clostridia bacterium]